MRNMTPKTAKQIILGLARDAVRGRGCTGSFDRDVEELIQEWEEKYKDGED